MHSHFFNVLPGGYHLLNERASLPYSLADSHFSIFSKRGIGGRENKIFAGLGTHRLLGDVGIPLR